MSPACFANASIYDPAELHNYMNIAVLLSATLTCSASPQPIFWYRLSVRSWKFRSNR